MKKLCGMTAVIMVFFCASLFVAEDSFAQRYGRSFGSYSTYRSSNGYRSFQPTPRTPRYTQTPRQMSHRVQRPSSSVSSSPRGSRPQLTNQFQRAARSLPKSVSVNSPVAKSSAFLGQVSKSGLPIVRTKAGEQFSIPQKGVVSNNLFIAAFNRSAIFKRPGYSTGVDKITGRIWSVDNKTYRYEGPMSPPPSVPVAKGAWGELLLEKHLGGLGNKPINGFKTAEGIRKLDRIVDGVGYEAKAGKNVKLTAEIKRQIRKDQELIQRGDLRRIEWHFFDGATQEVKDYLREHNIDFVEHPSVGSVYIKDLFDKCFV